MPRRLQVLLVVLLAIVGAGTAHAQVDSVADQLDAYWREAARTVAVGDLEGYLAIYHPDAVWTGVDATGSQMTRLIANGYERSVNGFAEVRAGRVWQRIAFRISRRAHDATTAHEVGISHFRRTAVGEEPVDRYDVVDSYLVRKGDRWVLLLSDQSQRATKAEWDALDSPVLGHDESPPR